MKAKDKWLSDILLFIILAVVMFIGSLVYNQIVYGDWTCKFKNCIEVKNNVQ